MEELIEEARKYAKDKDLFDEYVGHENPETVRTFLQGAVQKLRNGEANNLEELYSPELKEFLGLNPNRNLKNEQENNTHTTSRAGVKELTDDEIRDITVRRGEGWSLSIDSLVEILQSYSKLYGPVKYKWGGEKEIYSEGLTLDGAYKAILGKTKAEADKDEEKRREEKKREAEQEKIELEKKGKQWIERGEKIVSEDKKEEWGKYVEKRIQDDFLAGYAMEEALEFMEKVASGASEEELIEILPKIDNDNHKVSIALGIAGKFFEQDYNDLYKKYLKQTDRSRYKSLLKSLKKYKKEQRQQKKYEVTSKDLAVMSKEHGIGAKMIGKMKEIFGKIRHHDTDIGGR